MAVNLLLSYAFHAGTDLARVRRDLVCGRMLVDSGAFTAFTTGKVIDRRAYAEFLTTWAGCWDHAITLDVLGDPVATAANTAWLHRQGVPVMPVFTTGGKLAEFDAMVREVPYVCVGGTVGMPRTEQCARLRMLQRRAEELGGGIHALGVGSIHSLRAARPFSADSSAISSAFKFGTIAFYDGARLRQVESRDRAGLLRWREQLRAHGLNLAQVATTGRLPNQDGGRSQVLAAMSLAFAVMDEVLKSGSPVPPPREDRRRDSGTHLYSSLILESYARVAAGVDRQLHAEKAGPHLYNSAARTSDAYGIGELDAALHRGGRVPPIWAAHARHHVCPTRVQTATTTGVPA